MAASTITNGGFESNGATQTPTGWTTSGTAAADFTESGGRSGSFRLTHWSASAYSVRTTQTLTGVANGNFTLTVYVRNGGGQSSIYAGLEGCGSGDKRTAVPVTPDWLKIVVSTTVSGGSCTAVLSSTAAAGNWASFDDVSFTSGSATLSIKGADVSSLAKSEVKGGVYIGLDGVQRDALTILRNAGANYARLKVWVNPADGFNDKAHVLAMASRAKALGMKILIDFHYSDSWADPGKQNKPAAWASMSFTQLRTAVYNHTFDVLNALKAQGTTADMVQIGNELNDGMLWEDGRASTHFSQLAQLLNQGYAAAKAVSSTTLVALHLANGATNSLYRWFFDLCVSNGVNYDVIGASYYPYWHGTLAAMQANLADVRSRYGKPVYLAETAYPFTTGNDDGEGNLVTAATPYAGYPATEDGQFRLFRDVMSVVQAVGGLGVYYWEPTWTAVTGNGWDPTNPSSANEWENQALFDFSNRATDGLAAYNHQ
ncbi:arabinogalactan endo-1,4-beta-galactosidase [Streptosporangiaceae bacterium NEAU-GS5]|nr:arabinogalactan endo-1,4-beta-galactosidase [Streptosporangiaceae bacterium NEAU-GS5]